MKSKTNDLFSLILQIIITIVVLILVIVSLFINKKYFVFLEFSISIDLFIMAYNSKKIFNKPKIVNIYLGTGVLVLIYAILSVIGVF